MMSKSRNSQQDGKTIQDETPMLLILNSSSFFFFFYGCVHTESQDGKGDRIVLIIYKHIIKHF